ncbi:helix-turn-helix domain-containing protein [Janibacter hoylei]
MTYTETSLGNVMRELRTARGLTQEQLGVEAGYGAGAGVAISRMERGWRRPTDERLQGIADALGVTLSELESLVKVERQRLHEERKQNERRAFGGASEGSARNKKGWSARRDQPLGERLEAVQREVARRSDLVQSLGGRFNQAHEQARDGFFLPFVDIAAQVEGASRVEVPNDEQSSEEDAGDVVIDLTHARVCNALADGVGSALGHGGVGAAVGGAAAYATFTATAMMGTASTGTAIAGLTGAAATNATLAALGGGSLAVGGAGVAGGTLLLSGIVAAPAALLLVGGLVMKYRRSKRENDELAAQIMVAEGQLESSAAGFNALIKHLQEATEVLDYIGVHASHALSRWSTHLPDLPVAWSDLTERQQASFEDFREIAACELAVDSIDVARFLAVAGKDLTELVEATQGAVNAAMVKVTSLV